MCRTPWDYFDRPLEFLAWARGVAARTELVNPIEVLRWNAHKSYLVDLAGRGVPVVPTALVARGAGESERALRAGGPFGGRDQAGDLGRRPRRVAGPARPAPPLPSI